MLWALKLLARAREEGKVTLEPPVWANMVTAFEYIEDCNRKILNYGWIEFPLAYTQVTLVYRRKQTCCASSCKWIRSSHATH